MILTKILFTHSGKTDGSLMFGYKTSGDIVMEVIEQVTYNYISVI